MDSLINPNGEYQSFSKSMSGIYSVMHHMSYDVGDFSITIKLNVTNGLDIKKLYDKYEDSLSDYAKKAFEDFYDQDEVLARFDTYNFSLIEPLKLMQNIKNGYES